MVMSSLYPLRSGSRDRPQPLISLMHVSLGQAWGGEGSTAFPIVCELSNRLTD